MIINAPKPPHTTDAAEEAWLENIGYADWKSSPENVLSIVDQMLKKHGLEVRIYECGGDSYDFDIVEREPNGEAQ